MLIVPINIFAFFLVDSSFFIVSNAFFAFLVLHVHSLLACESFFPNFSNSKTTQNCSCGWLNFVFIPEENWLMIFFLLLFLHAISRQGIFFWSLLCIVWVFTNVLKNYFIENIVRVVNFSMPCHNHCLRPLHVWNFTVVTTTMMAAAHGWGTIKTISSIFKPSTHTFTHTYTYILQLHSTNLICKWIINHNQCNITIQYTIYCVRNPVFVFEKKKEREKMCERFILFSVERIAFEMNLYNCTAFHRTEQEFHLALAFLFLSFACKMK